jgi:hypothetical protein
MTEATMGIRWPAGITLGNVLSALVTIVAAGGILWGQWVLIGYRMDQTTLRVARLESKAETTETALAAIRLTYATAGSLRDLSAEQRQALAPLQAKIDTLIDRIAAVDRSQAETATGLHAVVESVGDLKRSLMGRQPAMFRRQADGSERPP